MINENFFTFAHYMNTAVPVLTDSGKSSSNKTSKDLNSNSIKVDSKHLKKKTTKSPIFDIG